MPKASSLTLLKIGDLVRLSGLSERTLRGYEKLGIITPARSDGGTRFYRESDINIAQIIHRMRELDIPVDTIRVIATKRRDFPTGNQSSNAMIEILENLSDVLTDRATKTILLQDELTKTIRLLRGCQGCENKPNAHACPDCPMETSPDQTGVSRLIWQQN